MVSISPQGAKALFLTLELHRLAQWLSTRPELKKGNNWSNVRRLIQTPQQRLTVFKTKVLDVLTRNEALLTSLEDAWREQHQALLHKLSGDNPAARAEALKGVPPDLQGALVTLGLVDEEECKEMQQQPAPAVPVTTASAQGKAERSQVEELRHREMALRKELKVLRNQARSAQELAERKEADMQRQITKLQEHLREARGTAESNEAAFKKIQAADRSDRERVKFLTKQVKDLGSTLETREASLERLRRVVEELEDDLAALKQQADMAIQAARKAELTAPPTPLSVQRPDLLQLLRESLSVGSPPEASRYLLAKTRRELSEALAEQTGADEVSLSVVWDGWLAEEREIIARIWDLSPAPTPEGISQQVIDLMTLESSLYARLAVVGRLHTLSRRLDDYYDAEGAR